MCGIFGLVARSDSGLSPELFHSISQNLFALSESRGKESAGVALASNGNIFVYKQPLPAHKMTRSREYRKLIDSRILSNDFFAHSKANALVGHSRLVTNGSQEKHDNNQPVVSEGIVGVHNGIVVNDSDLWEKHGELRRKYDVDTEVILSLARMYYNETGSMVASIRKVYSAIYGSASVALLFSDLDLLLVATNNGSLYSTSHQDGRPYIFASERYILQRVLDSKKIKGVFDPSEIVRIAPGTGQLIDLATLSSEDYSIGLRHGQVSVNGNWPGVHKEIVDLTPKELRRNGVAHSGAPHVLLNSEVSNERHLYYDVNAISQLKRCNKCILPETFPFIEFDSNGECNYCKMYASKKLRDYSVLVETLDRFRRADGEPDCLLMFSGGRDSSYAAHYVTSVLRMNPVTYTYDWGMVTDLARRNISRICGKLGLENVLISADIKKKRDNIRKNVVAWLRKPDMGMIPLFTAGDKHYFYYANMLKKQMDLRLTILSASPFEKTHFKIGFCGIPPFADHRPRLWDQLRVAFYYAARLVENPAYINSSIVDNLAGFISFYQISHKYLRLFDFIPWDEEVIESTLLDEYDWELAEDTTTTWRIGDGTASFYNYIYHTVAGFTENDTFRSNQIREGVISRERALELVRVENQPRYESLKWYLDVIGLSDSFADVIRVINAIPRLY